MNAYMLSIGYWFAIGAVVLGITILFGAKTKHMSLRKASDDLKPIDKVKFILFWPAAVIGLLISSIILLIRTIKGEDI